jgi:mono/diheme cytochrome c family protein
MAALLPMLAQAAGDHVPGMHGQERESGPADGHDDPGHMEEMPGHDQPADPAEAHDEGGMAGVEHMHGAGHAHAAWVTPPEPFDGMSSEIWGNRYAIKRGRTLYAENCKVCHGVDGKGTGVAADSLEHAPADLTQNLHSSAANNDGYLFWRVTKGGTVEPFRSRKSAMPAFEQALTPKQRWDVLAYVHDAFHHGFIEEAPAAATGAPMHGGEDHHGDEAGSVMPHHHPDD